MTATAPTGPQGTGQALSGPLTMVLESPARHRTDDRPYGPPSWFLILMTAVAGVTFAMAWGIHSLSLMLLAGLYTVVALGFDVVAAIVRRRAE